MRMKEFGQNIVKIPEKGVLFRENDFSKDIYVLKSGRIRLFKKIGNKNVMLCEVEPGGIFGEISVIDAGPRSATAIASKECEAIKITPAEFKEGLKNVPEWFMAIARVLAKRLRETDKKLNLSGPLVNEANVLAILVYLFNGADNKADGLPEQETEDTLRDLLHLPITDLQEAFDTLQNKKLISFKQNRILTDSIVALETHLEKIRKSFAASYVF
jgi:CRP-like cAMP-binding protein